MQTDETQSSRGITKQTKEADDPLPKVEVSRFDSGPVRHMTSIGCYASQVFGADSRLGFKADETKSENEPPKKKKGRLWKPSTKACLALPYLPNPTLLTCPCPKTIQRQSRKPQ